MKNFKIAFGLIVILELVALAFGVWAWIKSDWICETIICQGQGITFAEWVVIGIVTMAMAPGLYRIFSFIPHYKISNK
ncbi:MAG: hypothetical protein V4615_05070 [Bacteroidota bacterium]